MIWYAVGGNHVICDTLLLTMSNNVSLIHITSDDQRIFSVSFSLSCSLSLWELLLSMVSQYLCKVILHCIIIVYMLLLVFHVHIVDQSNTYNFFN